MPFILGVNTFQSSLLLERGIKVSSRRILKAFRLIPQWTMSLKRRRRFKRRQYMEEAGNQRAAELEDAVEGEALDCCPSGAGKPPGVGADHP